MSGVSNNRSVLLLCFSFSSKQGLAAREGEEEVLISGGNGGEEEFEHAMATFSSHPLF